jgi:hypothetical protein
MQILQERTIYFTHAMDGKFEIAESAEGTGGDMRYGGWTAWKRQADGVWLRDVQFHCHYTAIGLHIFTNVWCTHKQMYFPDFGTGRAELSMGTSFEAQGTGYPVCIDPPPSGDCSIWVYNYGLVHAWYPDYGFTSRQLIMEWCDGGTCPGYFNFA